MINNSVQKTLSKLATEIMRDNVESVGVFYLTKDGTVHSMFDKEEDGNAFALIGASKVMTDRITYTFVSGDRNDED